MVVLDIRRARVAAGFVLPQVYQTPTFACPKSNKTPPSVRKVTEKESETDPRVKRSTRQLGEALVDLLHERTFDAITVGDILRRAGVGRSTFYAHYRNKQDVLHSSYERMFAAFEHMLQRPAPGGAVPRIRLIPVQEFSAHVSEAHVLTQSLRDSGQMEDLWEMAIGHIARMIERRITPVPGATPAMPASLVSRMLAGAYLEMLKWWLDHPGSTTPENLDAAFHDIASATLARAKYGVVMPPVLLE